MTRRVARYATLVREACTKLTEAAEPWGIEFQPFSDDQVTIAHITRDSRGVAVSGGLLWVDVDTRSATDMAQLPMVLRGLLAANLDRLRRRNPAYTDAANARNVAAVEAYTAYLTDRSSPVLCPRPGHGEMAETRTAGIWDCQVPGCMNGAALPGMDVLANYAWQCSSTAYVRR